MVFLFLNTLFNNCIILYYNILYYIQVKMYKLNVIILVQILLIIILTYLDYKLSYIIYPCNNSKTEFKRLKWCYLEDIIQNLDSCDLVLFSAYDFSKNRIFSNLEYSHIGMILKTDKLYSIEMIQDDYIFPGYKTYKNINKFDLVYRILHYPGFVYIASYNNTLTNIQYNKFNKICNLPFTYSSTFQIFNTIIKQNNILCDALDQRCINKHQSIYCSNLIALILYNLNIYKFKNIKPINYHNTIINLCDGKLFTEPIRIISKKNIINNIYNTKINDYC